MRTRRCRLCGNKTVDYEKVPAFGGERNWAICYACWKDYDGDIEQICAAVPPSRMHQGLTIRDAELDRQEQENLSKEVRYGY